MSSHLDLLHHRMRIMMKHDDTPPFPLTAPPSPEPPTSESPPFLTSTQIFRSNTRPNDQEDDTIVLMCPHCKFPVIIEELNCGIFRHAVFKAKPTEQVPPHSSKAICDELVATDKVIGCCKPFCVVVIPETRKFAIEKCDYI